MIVFCGYANSDLTVHVPALPGPGDRVQAASMRRHDGGMAANAAAAAARMGGTAVFAGVVGHDPLSTAFLTALAGHGVDVSWTARDGAALTTAVILVTADGERSVISQDDEVDAARVAAVVDRLARAGGGRLYLDGYRFPWAAPVLAAAAPVVRAVVDLDGCEDPAAAREALAAAEHVVVGREQAERVLGPDPGAAAAAHGTHLVVTDGAAGWRLYAPDGRTHAGPALDVPVRDTTGAGDCFTGSYLAELERGAPPAGAAAFAAAAAGLSCTAPGARSALPERAEVVARLAP